MWLTLFGFLCAGVEALASDALTFEAVTTVAVGQGAPSVTFHPQVKGQLRVSMACGSANFGVDEAIRPGSPVHLPLNGLAEGVHDCRGEVVLTADDGSDGRMPLTLQVSVLPLVALSSTLEDVDLAGGTLNVRTSRGVSEATLDLYGVRGAHLGGATHAEISPNELHFAWTPTGDEVVKLTVRTRDAAGFTSELDLWPWFYEIPHEDVNFASGSHEITNEEIPKLERSWSEIVEVMELYGSIVDIKLFVAGYTDTVGPAGSNQALSERRARAIAGWFRQRGFSRPVAYQGFGEEAPAVSTADETDEIRNRRAVYVLAAQPPPSSHHIPRARWTPLR